MRSRATWLAMVSLFSLSACAKQAIYVARPMPAPSTERAAVGNGAPTSIDDSDVRCVFEDGVEALGIEELAADGPYPVARIDEELTRDGRSLDTAIWYPAAEGGWIPFRANPVAADGPFPLIVYSHGFFSDKDEATLFGEHMASRGYIVVAPTFPLSSMWADEPTLGDLHNQARDVSFLIDHLLAASADPEHRFHDAVDGDRVGAAGMSLGGFTTSLVTYHRTLHDPRIKAAATLAGPGSVFGEDFYRHRDVPLLAVHGDLDALVDYRFHAQKTLARAQPNVNLLTIEGASHTGFAHIPMEGAVLFFGSWIAPEGAHDDNPDGMACGLLDGLLPEDGDFLEPLGGLENGIIDASDDPGPCSPELLAKPAITPRIQRALTRPALAGFFDAYLGADATERSRSCHFLHEVYPRTAGVALD